MSSVVIPSAVGPDGPSHRIQDMLAGPWRGHSQHAPDPDAIPRLLLPSSRYRDYPDVPRGSAATSSQHRDGHLEDSRQERRRDASRSIEPTTPNDALPGDHASKTKTSTSASPDFGNSCIPQPPPSPAPRKLTFGLTLQPIVGNPAMTGSPSPSPSPTSSAPSTLQAPATSAAVVASASPTLTTGRPFLSNNRRPEPASRKRRRPLSDVDGPNTASLPLKKRRLRLQPITSRLSRPFSVPASHVLFRDTATSPGEAKRFLKLAAYLAARRNLAVAQSLEGSSSRMTGGSGQADGGVPPKVVAAQRRGGVLSGLCEPSSSILRRAAMLNRMRIRLRRDSDSTTSTTSSGEDQAAGSGTDGRREVYADVRAEIRFALLHPRPIVPDVQTAVCHPPPPAPPPTKRSHRRQQQTPRQQQQQQQQPQQMLYPHASPWRGPACRLNTEDRPAAAPPPPKPLVGYVNTYPHARPPPPQFARQQLQQQRPSNPAAVPQSQRLSLPPSLLHRPSVYAPPPPPPSWPHHAGRLHGTGYRPHGPPPVAMLPLARQAHARMSPPTSPRLRATVAAPLGAGVIPSLRGLASPIGSPIAAAARTPPVFIDRDRDEYDEEDGDVDDGEYSAFPTSALESRYDDDDEDEDDELALDGNRAGRTGGKSGAGGGGGGGGAFYGADFGLIFASKKKKRSVFGGEDDSSGGDDSEGSGSGGEMGGVLGFGLGAIMTGGGGGAAEESGEHFYEDYLDDLDGIPAQAR